MGAFGAAVPDEYDGFHWSQISAIVTQDFGSNGDNGYQADLHSGNSVGYVSPNSVGTISADHSFRLVDGYFAAGWDLGMTVTVDGYRGGVQVVEKHFTVDDTTSTLFHFGRAFRDLDSVSFSASGGTQDPNANGGGAYLVMEDLKVKAEPFPTTSPVHQDLLDHHFADHSTVSHAFAV